MSYCYCVGSSTSVFYKAKCLLWESSVRTSEVEVVWCCCSCHKTQYGGWVDQQSVCLGCGRLWFIYSFLLTLDVIFLLTVTTTFPHTDLFKGFPPILQMKLSLLIMWSTTAPVKKHNVSCGSGGRFTKSKKNNPNDVINFFLAWAQDLTHNVVYVV